MLTELVITGSMHERKRVMAERSDAFAVLPGGIGTLDEMFEIVTWRQLGLHDKPVFLVDIDGYWQPLRALLDHLVAQGFAAPLVPRLLQIVPDVPELLGALRHAQPGGGPAARSCHEPLRTRRNDSEAYREFASAAALSTNPVENSVEKRPAPACRAHVLHGLHSDA